MTVRIIEQRYCDVCERDYEPDKPDWMILSAPNAPEDMEAAWDFCSYACLSRWIATDESEDEVETEQLMSDLGPETPKQRTPEELAAAQARLDAAMRDVGEMPQAMTLMEAIASGQMDFGRGPE